MTDDRHDDDAQGAPRRWEPLPQGEYDAEATAFVHFPEGALDEIANTPLAAPGHGYVPPQITVAPAAAEATDPAATGNWVVPGAEAPGAPAPGAPPGAARGQQPQQGRQPQQGQEVHWPDPNAPQDAYGYRPGATGQWNLTDGTFVDGAAPADGEGVPADGTGGTSGGPSDVTGQWSIPVARGDLPDESGEFTTSALASQWGGTPPATLPGGAPAPWATGAETGQPWGAEPPGEPGQQPYPPQRPHPSDDPPPAHPPHGQAQARTDTQQPPGAAGGPPAGEAAGPRPRKRRPIADRRLAVREQLAQAEALRGAGDDTGPPVPETSPEPHPEPHPESASVSAPAPAPEQEHEPAQEPAQEAAPVRPGPETDSEPVQPDGTGPVDVAPLPQDEHPLGSYVLRVNGTDRPVTGAWIGESLLYVLRERLGLAGAKDGCSQGECGACNVQVDGRLVASCLVPAATAAGSEVRTVEGLAADGRPSDVQRALARCGAVQCGFCVPGMAMTVHDLLEGNPSPSDLETRQALCGNLCRCSGYRGVLDAVRDVVAGREAASAAAEPEVPDDGAEAARIPHQAGPGGVNAVTAQHRVFDQQGRYEDDGGRA